MLYFDRDGAPISRDAFVRLFENATYRRVALYDEGDTFVSTVWLGIDHGFRRGAAPVIFETLVRCPRAPDQDVVARYSTIAEARAGHEKWVAACLGDSLTSSAL